MKFCWENGFWADIFGPPKEPWGDMYGATFKRPGAPLLEEDLHFGKSSRVMHRTSGSGGKTSFLNAVRDREILTWKQKRDKERAEALTLWLALLISWPSCLAVVGQLKGMSEGARQGMIEDLLGHKAPATLRKRYRSLLSYDVFLRSRSILFPGSEEIFYAFLCFLRDEGKPASTRKAVLEAITFARFVLGIPELALLGESKRCHGSARRRDFKARVQASPFTVDELCKLHKILFEDPEPWNQLMAGSLLFCTYARVRWEDLEHADALLVDKGEDGLAAYIEAGVGVHKTMGAKLMKGQLLPLVAPATGVVEGNWVEQYMRVRRSMGVKDPPEGPIMPAPDRQGAPTVRSLDSDEAGAWARLLLFGSTDVLPDRRVSSHSCKCTCISFATKFGASPDQLLLLGYHTGDFKMPLTYGRDAASPILLLLNKIFRAIRLGTFKPDCTRSGRFVNAPATVMIEIKDEEDAGILPSHPSAAAVDHVATCEPPCEGGDSSVPGTTGSSSSSDTHDSQGPAKISFTRWVIPDPPAGRCYYEHTKVKTLHIAQEGHTRSFECGRTIGPLHKRVDGRPGAAYTRCRLCAKIAEALV